MILLWSLFGVGLITGPLFFAVPGASVAYCPLQKRDPDLGDVFQDNNIVPNALDPNFLYEIPANKRVTIQVKPGFHDAFLIDHCAAPATPPVLLGETTKIYGYAAVGDDPTWPGNTFQVQRAVQCRVTWDNQIPPGPYIITGADNTEADPDGEGVADYGNFSDIPVVDTSLHWAYSLPDLRCDPECDCDPSVRGDCRTEDYGVPIVTHLHGGHTDAENDGNPEFFYNHNLSVVGPQFETTEFTYGNNLEAASIWYHDHALGITRLNVYAGMAGFYFLRDGGGDGGVDTGESGNRFGFPVFPYEVALAIQDRMFKNNGEFLYPAFPGDPDFKGFIDVEEADTSFERGFTACGEQTTNCGPTALAEFFGDHMVVNGKVWPSLVVEPCQYRLRLLNGCDSRFLVLEFVQVAAGAKDPTEGTPLQFAVIGTDQGRKTKNTGPIDGTQDLLVMGPGERADVIIDFNGLSGSRIIMKNSGGDTPFGGQVPVDPAEQIYTFTNRIMAFDVEGDTCNNPDTFDLGAYNEQLNSIGHVPVLGQVSRIRKVGLFEGRDEFNRLQPLLGPAEEATDYTGTTPITWPNDCDNDGPYCEAGLVGPVEGTVGWHTEPATENPKHNDVELWEIWNLSADAHPIHLHLVDFEVIGRYEFQFNDGTDPEEPSAPIDPMDAVPGTGVYVQAQPLVQHTGEIVLDGGRKAVFDCGSGNCLGEEVDSPYNDIGYPKDVVIANPGQMTIIKAKFHKTGRYVWHCHILSHEDHEMMRVLYVGRDQTTERNLRGDAESKV